MKVDDVKKLLLKKHREKQQRFLVEGEHLVLELQKAAQTNAHWQSAELFITEDKQDWVAEHITLPFAVTVVGAKAMKQMSDTPSPQGIIAVAPFCKANSASIEVKNTTEGVINKERAVYLVETQDPGNLGTILRSCAWFGGIRCLLSPNSVDPYNPKVVRSSMGAIFHVAIEQDVTLETVAQRYPRIACLDMNGLALRDASFSEFDCYVFGNEARGVPREALQAMNATAFSIAGCGAIESLNLASAVNMALYELNR